MGPLVGPGGVQSNVYDLGALIKEAKNLAQLELQNRKPKKEKTKTKRSPRLSLVPPDVAAGKDSALLSNANLVHSDDDTTGRHAALRRRQSRAAAGPRPSTTPRASTGGASDGSGNGGDGDKYPFPNPNIYSLAGCGSNALLHRVLELAYQQNETVKQEKKNRKDRERSSQMPVLGSSCTVQDFCAKMHQDGLQKPPASGEKSWNRYF